VSATETSAVPDHRPDLPARPPGLLRRVTRRAGRELAGLRRTTVRRSGRDTVRVIGLAGLPRRLRLDDPAAHHAVRSGTLTLRLADPAALARLAAAGLLTGELRRLRVRLATVPGWLREGVRPPALGRTCTRFGWRRRGRGLAVRLAWTAPYPVERALADVLAATLRARPWDQASGPLYALDRTAWLEGGSAWPQGRLAAAAPDSAVDELGRPLGAFAPPGKLAGPLPPPIVTAVANPYGRRLVGAATRYRLAGGALRDEAGETVLRLDPADPPEAAVLRGGFAKYAVVTVDGDASVDPALAALAACGMVFAAPDPAVRSALAALGLVTVADPAEVDDLTGYALSVAAARQAAIGGDAALRRTALNPAGDAGLPLPTVSVLLSSMREDHIGACLGYLADQTYPALEVVVGLHGYRVPESTVASWQALLPYPLRVRPFPAELPFGAVLGELSRTADGELLTKVDDDDHYGRHHVTDLVLAWHATGAELVAKGARFVHLPERDETIDRAWAAPEGFGVTPAGGTMLLSRGTLQQAGGWSHSSKHVDADLLERIGSAGGLVYRTHALEYVYVRRSSGHTFATGTQRLLAHGERTYPGLPAALIRPAATATDR
jgi:hypothetical protein